MSKVDGKTARRALVIGRGSSGRAAEKALRELGYETVDFIDGYGMVVASPGVPVKSELQLGCERLKRRGTKLIAVTGSKGKSSVVKLVAEALGGVPCGNYGLPVCDVGETGWAVVEVSSFQLETTALSADTFEAAAILNLQEDHLDRHGTADVYHSLKRRLRTMAKASVECAVGEGDRARFDALLKGSYFDNDILRSNGEMAAWLMEKAGLDAGAIAAAFARFEPLPHRMNLVGEFGGVRFIDDSKATSLAALAAGVTMAGRNVRLIAGGLPKGDDPFSVREHLTNRVKKVYLIGTSAKVFAEAWSEAVDCEICGTMEAAVAGAISEAEKGDTVLLSPGTASFDQFKSFGERGDVFADLVIKQGKKDK